MNLIELQQYTISDDKSEKFLRAEGILKQFDHCPYCESTRITRIRRSKHKCYECRKEWGPRRGSILEGLRVPLARVLIAIKLFELDTSVRESAHQLGLSYNTVYDLFDLFGKSIIRTDGDTSSTLSGEIEMDESYFGGKRKGNRGRGAAGKIPVFGILERGGKVRVEVVQNVTGETLLTMAIKKVKRGSLIYTDKFRSYNGLISYGFRHMRIDHGKRFVNGKVYINGIEGFWSFAKERLMKYHGVNPRKFPLYLKELEFRYNHRHHDLYDDLVKCISEYSRGAFIQ
jgi:transposase